MTTYEAPPSRGESTTRPAPIPAQVYTAREIADMAVPEGDTLPGLVAAGTVTVVHSAPKVGKSLLLWSGVSEILTTGTWWGVAIADPTMTIEVVSEEPVAVLQRKFKQVQLPIDQEQLTILPAKLRKPEHLAWDGLVQGLMLNWRLTAPPTLLVIDTFGWFAASGKDLNSYGEIARMLEPLQLLMNEWPDLSILLLHHSRKGGGDATDASLGSTALSGLANAIFGITRSKEGANVRRVTGATQWDGDQAFILTWHEDMGRYVKGKPARAEDAVLAVLKEADGPLTIREIMTELRERHDKAPSEGTVKRVLKKNADLFKSDDPGKGKTAHWEAV